MNINVHIKHMFSICGKIFIPQIISCNIKNQMQVYTIDLYIYTVVCLYVCLFNF